MRLAVVERNPLSTGNILKHFFWNKTSVRKFRCLLAKSNVPSCAFGLGVPASLVSLEDCGVSSRIRIPSVLQTQLTAI
jgi:hypothetical protein